MNSRLVFRLQTPDGRGPFLGGHGLSPSTRFRQTPSPGSGDFNYGTPEDWKRYEYPHVGAWWSRREGGSGFAKYIFGFKSPRILVRRCIEDAGHLHQFGLRVVVFAATDYRVGKEQIIFHRDHAKEVASYSVRDFFNRLGVNV